MRPLLLVLVPTARAGTIELKRYEDPDDGSPIRYYVFTAAPGERNDITVERVDGGVRLTDGGGPIAGCAADGPGVVRCRDHPVLVDAGDEDDTVVGDKALGQALGGPGNDREQLGIDLATGVGGAAGENDRLANFEDAWGGLAHDVLIGTDGPNELRGSDSDRGAGDELDGRGGDDSLMGGTGADVLSGGGGADVLVGFEGADAVDGGAGGDELRLSGDPRLAIVCGPGVDTAVLPIVPGPLVPADCEQLHAGPLRIAVDGLQLAIRWETRLQRRPCRLRVAGTTLRDLSRLRARSVALQRGTETVTLRPSRRCSGRLGTAYAPIAFRLTS